MNALGQALLTIKNTNCNVNKIDDLDANLDVKLGNNIDNNLDHNLDNRFLRIT